MSHFLLFRQMLEDRIDRPDLEWFRKVSREIAEGVPDSRFCALLSLASRHARRTPLGPSEEEQARVQKAVNGFSTERWSMLEVLRVALVLARTDLQEESCALAIEEAFRFADDGEAIALYRTLALLPSPERFAWRVGEGCRTNMTSVFEAAALDTPYPALYFDDVAFNQAAIKCVFVGAPLWRMWGLDDRLTPELARMALDLVDERRSAHRPVPYELWLCLGSQLDERAEESLEQELDPANPHRRGRRAAVYALARAGGLERLEARVEREEDPEVLGTIRHALAGNTASEVFRGLDPSA